MVAVEFEAPEYRADATFESARFRIEGDTSAGFRVLRNGAPWLELGPGYRLLRTVACGVCSTDLDRHFLPFPLPQVTGHELVALDAAGQRHVVEINATPRARGLRPDCPDCAAGLERHCPERLVLGIHDLPGGFGPWVLAPERAAIPVPDIIPTDVALLVEPFAAALRAVDRLAVRAADVVAVLGPRRLGMLVIAALAARRRQGRGPRRVVAVVRRAELGDVARRVGADDVELAGSGPASVDVVVDTTGSPAGFERALGLARREVHLKSTHGRPAGGLVQATALVVDELAIERWEDGVLTRLARGRRRLDVAWLSGEAPPAVAAPVRIVVAERATAGADLFPAAAGGCIAGADVAVVDRLSDVDAAIRPSPGSERSALRPTGTILVREAGDEPLGRAVVDRGLRLSSSRCGDFGVALELLAADAELRDRIAGLITHRVDDVGRGFELAREPAAIKVVVRRPSA